MGEISELGKALMDREMARDPEQFRAPVSISASPPERTLSPGMLATLGGLTDAGSTYAFMKRGTAKEKNPLVNAIAKQHPEMTALTAVGGLLATKAATNLIGRKWPKVANAIAANLGAQQLAMGTRNLSNTFRLNEGKQGSFGRYGDSMIRSGINESIKNHSR